MNTHSELELMRDLKQEGGKIVLMVVDGLGGLPMEPGGPTELEAARTPNLDRLAAEGTTGLSVPIRPGVTPGSGPAHLSLFGYDPLIYDVGRGVLEALGIGFDLRAADLAARGNFATADDDGVIVDRRAGRIPTDACERLCEKLAEATSGMLPGYELFVRPIREHRFALVIRGDHLGGDLTETDPLQTGLRPLPVRDQSGSAAGARTAELVNRWVAAARDAIADEPRANTLNLRGLSMRPHLPVLSDVAGLSAGAIAVYPMYRGAAALVGMELVDFEGERPADEISALEASWSGFDFFFVHFKKPDSYGEDGDFEAKAKEIEAVDSIVPRVLDLRPDVVVVTGDHSTPAAMRSHSWHPVPTLLWGQTAMVDTTQQFGERSCAGGALGTFHATTLLPLAMAHAGRLKRFGA